MPNRDLLTEVSVDPITSDMLTPLIEDYSSDKFTKGLSANQLDFKDQVVQLFKDPELLNAADPYTIVGNIIRQGNRIGGVDDIVAKASRDIFRLKGDRLDENSVSTIFNDYGITLPPIDDIKFKDYDSLDDEHQKVDGWAQQAKSNYSLQAKTKSPELLGYRDEVFQQIDDSAKYMKRQVGATGNEGIDFLGRLAEGVASTFDSVGLDSAAKFIQKHVSTNPEWDSSTHAVIGQALGQMGSLMAAAAGAEVVGTYAAGAAGFAGIDALAGTLLARGTVASSALGGTQDERYNKTLQATGSENLADTSAHETSAYLEAGIDYLADASVLAGNKLGVGKLLEKGTLKDGAREALADGLQKSKPLRNFQKAVEVGGETLWSGTKEGVTEVLQGAISDNSVGQLTNMRDRFEPYDINNRAVDFLGGFAGGVGAEGVQHFVLKKPTIDNAKSQEQSAALLDGARKAAQDLGANAKQGYNAAVDAVQANIQGTTIRDKVDSTKDFIKGATDNIVNSTLAQQAGDLVSATGDMVSAVGRTTQDLIIAGMADFAGSINPEIEAKSRENLKKTYTGIRDSLGNLINHPHVQRAVDAGLGVISSMKAYIPAARPKDAPIVETATNTDSAVNGVTEPTVASIVTPQDATVTSQDVAQAADNTATVLTDPSVSATDMVTTETTTPHEVLTQHLSALPNTTDTTLENGNRQISFTVGEKSFVGSKEDRAVNRGDAATRQSQTTYSAEVSPDGTVSNFQGITSLGRVIPNNKITDINSLNTEVGKLRVRQDEATARSQFRNQNEMFDHKGTEVAVRPNVRNALPKHTKNFVNQVDRPGGIAGEVQGDILNYLNGPDALNDLVASGLSETEASEAIQKIAEIRSKAYKDQPDRSAKAAKIKSIVWDVIGRNLGKEKLYPLLDASLSSKQSKEIKRLLERKGVTVAEPIQATSTVRHEENPVVQDIILRSVTASDKEFQMAKDALASNPAQAIQIKQGIRAKLDDLGINPDTATPEDIQKAVDDSKDEEIQKEFDRLSSEQFNTGAFKTRNNIPIQKSRFALGRIFEKLGLKSKALEAQPVTGEAPITGKYSKGTVSVADPTLRGQQGTFIGWHELGESALSGTSLGAIKKAATKLGIDHSVIDSQIEANSDAIRETPAVSKKEKVVDAIAESLYDPEGFATKYPELAQALSSHAQDNPTTAYAKTVDTVKAEDAIPALQKFQERGAADAIARDPSNTAMATRNEDTRTGTQKIKDALGDFNNKFLDSAYTIKQKMQNLATAIPSYEATRKTLDRYFEQFKNRHQRAQEAHDTIRLAVGNLATKLGVPLATVDRYLKANRIANEKAFWEKSVKDSTLTPEQFTEVLRSSEALGKLIDPAIENLINNGRYAEAVNELSSKAYTAGTAQEARMELYDPQDVLRHALSQAMNPDSASRGGIRNSGEFDTASAQADLEALRSELTPEQYQGLESLSNDILSPIMKSAIEDLHSVGAISATLRDFYTTNSNNYVPFQLSDAIAEDPFVSAALRNQAGMSDLEASPTAMMMIKTGNLRARASKQALGNIYSTMFHALNTPGKLDVARPVAATDIANNPWFANNGVNVLDQNGSSILKTPPLAPGNISLAEGKDVQEIPIAGLYNKQSELQAQNPDKSYVISTDGGFYTLHEVEDPNLKEVMQSVNKGEPGDLGRFLNNAQIISRLAFTTYSPVFPIRAAFRAASNLYRMKSFAKTGEVPTMWQMAKSFLQAPLMGIPIDANDRKLMWDSYKAAGNYMTSKGNVDTRVAALNDALGTSFTPDQILNNPEIIQRMIDLGDLVGAAEGISSGIDPDTIAASPYGSEHSLLHDISNGRPPHKRLLDRALNYQGNGKELVQGAGKAMRSVLDNIKAVNDRLELAEKILGVTSMMQQGVPYEEAVVRANLNFGNPDPRGGGSMRKTISPLMLYSTSYLNGIRVFQEMVKGGISDPVKDGRLLRASVMSIRNRMFTSPLVLGALTYGVARALGGDDDEASKEAEVIRRLIQNIPETDRGSGFSIPLPFFRDPRTREWHFAGSINDPSEIDPSWTTPYISTPYDQATAAISGGLGGFFDTVGEGVGLPSMVGAASVGLLGGLVPSFGPVLQTGIGAAQVARGQNPTDFFTGKPIADDKDFQKGGAQLGLTYLHAVANEFFPVIIPGASHLPEGKTRMGAPTGLALLDQFPQMLKLGVIKESNYGSRQADRRSSGVEDSFSTSTADDMPTEVKATLNRLNELSREARQRLAEKKDELLKQGLSAKEANVKSADLLPEGMRMELKALSAWKRANYDVAKEKAEIALRAGDKKEYQQFLQGAKDTIPQE